MHGQKTKNVYSPIREETGLLYTLGKYAKVQCERRWLNEELYTSTGEHAFKLMQGQPDLFQQYHEVRHHFPPYFLSKGPSFL